MSSATGQSGIIDHRASVVAQSLGAVEGASGMTGDNRRMVVFTGNASFSVRKGIVEIDRAISGLSWLILVHQPRRSLRQILLSQWRNLRRNGWRWIPYQLGDLRDRLLRSGDSSGRGGPGTEFTLAGLVARPNVRVVTVPDIHSPETLALVREFVPWLGISLAAPILRRELFAIPTLGTLNLHKGKVPDYRGMPPAFWELWNDEQSVGCTVHWVDDRLDTGAVAGEALVQRSKYSTLRGLQLCLDETGVGLMRDVIWKIEQGEVPARAQDRGGSTYRKPTLAQAELLQLKVAAGQPQMPRSAAKLVKEAVTTLVRWGWRAGAHRLARPRITVLLYHRVSDDARDNLTVGVEQFDRQMELLRRHCRVLSIEEVLQSRTIPESPVPLVCVTFDDGYLDNFLHAAPILLRHQVPAAFFVSTGIIDSEAPFPHDVRRENPAIPVMRWEHLRQMRAAGFVIGSHTVSHIDCASEAADVVWKELVDSRAALIRELGVGEYVFAYPYGGRQHITAERRDMVSKAGFVGCLAAYGGSNVGSVDPFDVRRRGIHWEFSDRAFLFACSGVA